LISLENTGKVPYLTLEPTLTTLKTKRLILRPWREEDLEPFAQLNADPRVMEYFPRPKPRGKLSNGKKDATKIEERGWGWWAVSSPGISEFIVYRFE
jgi:3-dehydroquinate dehydratase/shikimate dehydrogenase